MVHLCACTGGSSSSLESCSSRDGSKSCKSCGGKLAVEAKGGLSGSMPNTMGLELPRPIDLDVKWKTTTRGRQRAVRRARTSFNMEDRLIFSCRSSNWGESTSGQESSKAGEIPVSESEKLGVSILGRRFSDPVESDNVERECFPIKKRRFLMAPCSSTPTNSSQQNESEILSSTFGGSLSQGKQPQEKVSPKDTSELISDDADFSGISILAAAACESGMDADLLSCECSMPSGQSLKERKLEDIMRSTELSSLPEIKEEKLDTLEDSHCKRDTPSESSSSVLHDKALDGFELNGPSNLDEAVVGLHVASEKAKNVDTSRDARFHWDLNVAMEVWENCDQDMMTGSEVTAPVTGENCGNDDEMKEHGTCQNIIDCSHTKDMHNSSDSKIEMIDGLKEVKMKQESDISSLPSWVGSAQKVQQLEHASLELKDSSGETKPSLKEQKSSCAPEVGSDLEPSSVDGSLAPLSEAATLTATMKKVEISESFSMLEQECSSISIDMKDLAGVSSNKVCEMNYKVERSTSSKPLSEESTNLATFGFFNKSYANLGLNDVQIAQQTISEVEKQELCDIDSRSGKMNPSAENGSGVSCAGENVVDADTDVKLLDTHVDNGQKSANLDESFSTFAKEYPAATIVVDNNILSINEADVSNTKTACITDIVSGDCAPNTEGIIPAVVDRDGVVGSQAAAKSYPNGYEDTLCKVESSNFLNHHGYESDASHIGKFQAAGMEKVEVEDDDSQYEDGELRDSGHHCWAEDGFDEVETGHLDYGSDYKGQQAASNVRFASKPLDTTGNRQTGFSIANNEGIQARNKASDAADLMKCSSLRNFMDAASGKRSAGSADEKIQALHLRVKDDDVNTRMLVGPVANATDSQFHRITDDSRENPMTMRMKSTGWDLLPESVRSLRHGFRDVVDSVNRNDSSSLSAARGDDSLRHMRASSDRNLSLRVERPRSFDRSNRNDQSHNEACRSNDGYRFNAKDDRTFDARRLLGRGGASRQTQVSSRAEWVETANCSGSTRYRSPEYYRYNPPGPMNAAETAVAKMKSNGFVVAPDGTLVKAVGGAAGRGPRRSGDTTLHISNRIISGRSPINRDCGISRGPTRDREMGPDEHFGRNRSGRHIPEMENDRFHRVGPDGSMNSVQRSLSQRQRSFSPYRAPPHLPRTATPSRSRSRSPPGWTSPSGRRNIVANGCSSLNQHSRSPPTYRTEVRIDRMRSPRRRPIFEERMVRCNPSSRSRAISPRVSRWIDERRCSHVDLRENNYKISGRISPLGISSRNERFDVLESPGRSRPEEYYQSVHSSRVPAYVFERGTRHDGNGVVRREYGDRYEALHSVRQYDRNCGMKQLHDDSGDAFRSRNPALKSPESQRRGSPRIFERRLGDSPHGANKEEKDHFNYARNEQDNAAYKPFELQDCGDDATVQERSS